ncbi:TPA: hypothetical protein EYH33_06370 [Candidatus Bipolaricaulota bacterium]|nr:hypothetical protein [Candidatus Bipolaricaulota bacterium]
MTRYLGLVAVLVLALAIGACAQSLEQILAQTGLDPDLVSMLTVEQGGQKFLLVFVFIDERTLESNVRPEIAQAIAPYVGQNAVMIWAYSEDGASFDPGAIWFAQGEALVTLAPELVVPIAGDFLSGVIPGMTPVAAVVVLGEAIDPAQPFEIHYGDLVMASMAVNMALAQAEATAQATAQAEATAQAQATGEASAAAEVQAQGVVVEGEPCGPCAEAEAEPCGCDPCSWLTAWWSNCCPEVACADCDPCDPCATGGFIVPFLLLLLLGL